MLHRLLVVLLVALCAASATAQSAPGETFTIAVHARGSARAAFREAFGALRGLDGVTLRSALADKNDRFVEGFFTASFHGRAMTGALLAGTSGVAAGAFDTPQRAPRTLPALLARLRSAPGAAARPLHQVSFGSGTIALPDSWNVANAYQGCVEASSAQDHGYLAFGCPQAALAPPLMPDADPRTVLVVTSADSVRALERVLTSPPPVGLGVSAVRFAEVQPVALRSQVGARRTCCSTIAPAARRFAASRWSASPRSTAAASCSTSRCSCCRKARSRSSRPRYGSRGSRGASAAAC